MKKLLILGLFLSLFISCKKPDHLETLPEALTNQLIEQQRIKKRIETEKIHAFSVIDMLGIPDKIYIINEENNIEDFWYYENAFPFYRKIVVYFENGRSKSLRIIKSIKLQVEEAD